MQRINPYQVVSDFEDMLSIYTGAPYVATTTSCTMALLLALKADMARGKAVGVPRRTYVGVPMSVLNAGARIEWHDRNWRGAYNLGNTRVYDSARWFTRDLFHKVGVDARMVCVSFHASKTLGLEQGGAILHNIPGLQETLLRLRFDGRYPGFTVADDEITFVGLHCPMIPSVAAAGLMKLSSMMDKVYAPLPNDDYPDLSLMEAFRK